MKQFILLVSAVLLSFCAKAQTFFYMDSAQVAAGDVSNCGFAEVAAFGYYSDPCSYHPTLGDSATVSGTNLYLHVATRNLSCDSGVLCLAVIVPGDTVFNVPLSGVASGTYNAFLVNHNICPVLGNSIDSIAAGAMTISNSLPTYLAVITHTPSSGIILGTNITYTLNTNASTTFIVDWYVNGVLSQSGSMLLTFMHAQAYAKDSVYAVMRYKVQNCDGQTISNGNVTLVQVPEAIGTSAIALLSVSIRNEQILFQNMPLNEYYRIVDMQGNIALEGCVKHSSFTIDASALAKGVYLLYASGMKRAVTFALR
jgi:hypothetical protein